MNGSGKPPYPQAGTPAVCSTNQRLHLERPVPSCSSGIFLILLLCENQPTSFLRLHSASLVVPQFSEMTPCCFRPVSHVPLKGLICLFDRLLWSQEENSSLVSAPEFSVGPETKSRRRSNVFPISEPQFDYHLLSKG